MLLLVEVLLQPLIFFLRQSHETAMLRTCHTLNINRIVKVRQVLVCLTDAVVLRTVAVLDIGNAPSLFALNLECAAALTLLLSLKIHKISLVWFRPWTQQMISLCMEDTRMSTFLLDQHVILSITLQIVDVCVYRGIAPVKKDTRLSQLSGE